MFKVCSYGDWLNNRKKKKKEKLGVETGNLPKDFTLFRQIIFIIDKNYNTKSLL